MDLPARYQGNPYDTTIIFLRMAKCGLDYFHIALSVGVLRCMPYFGLVCYEEAENVCNNNGDLAFCFNNPRGQI
ncbi:hypothetical protein PZA11_003310 [Diplocarpon coronariae]